MWETICENCKKKYQPHTKLTKFNILKDIIIFSIQRFDRNSLVKNNNKIRFYDSIDLFDIYDGIVTNINLHYKLFGIINHIGNISNGHYYSIIKLDNKWFEFNDDLIRRKQVNYHNEEVCILFYIRDN